MGANAKAVNLLNVTLAAAVAAVPGPTVGVDGAKYLTVEAILTVVGGGTTVKVWIQTTLDGGATWIDIMSFAFTNSTASKVSAVSVNTALAAAGTPGSGSLADNTILSGLIGSQLRALYTTTGTFTGATTLKVTGVASS